MQNSHFENCLQVSYSKCSSQMTQKLYAQIFTIRTVNFFIHIQGMYVYREFYFNCPNRRQPQCASIGEWICIHTMEFYLAIKGMNYWTHTQTQMKLKCILLSGKNQKLHINECLHKVLQKRKTVKNRKIDLWLSRVGRGESG